MTNDLQTVVQFGSGWHDEERDDIYSFRWMGRGASVVLQPQEARARFLSFKLFSEFLDLSQILAISCDDHQLSAIAVLHGWNTYSVALPAADASKSIHLRFELSKLFPKSYYPSDKRELGIRLADLRLHGDASLHAHLERAHENSVLNYKEMMEKRETLNSFPQLLGIDLFGRCNMKPPCVYCFWDENKEQEDRMTDAVVDAETLRSYGGFFECARALQNCSTGEPLMHSRLAEVLEAIDSQAESFEMTTNGHLLTPRAVQALAGKKINLYVSLDAATKETYSRIRNDRFETIVANLHRLADARKEHGGWPRVYIVFMPMRVNLSDLEACFRLCLDIQADALVLRSLIPLKEMEIIKDRAGYRFDYGRELLSEQEYRSFLSKCMEGAHRHGVRILNQTDFGQDEPEAPKARPAEQPPAPQEDLGHSRMPLCREPWQSYFILRRGIFPCCYGHQPIAPMGDYEKTWNSPVMREIRGHLARGTFSKYCVDCHTCPIVQRHVMKKEPGPIEWKPSFWTRTARSMDRLAFGLPKKAWKRLKG